MTTLINTDREMAASLIDGLSSLLLDAVAGGASVGYLDSLDRTDAEAYWRSVANALEPGESALIVALTEIGQLAGAVQLVRCPKPNGRHRAEVCKLMVLQSKRGQGLGRRLMQGVERLAAEWGVTLLVLDTATKEAEALYAGMGYTQAGEIPGYAANPDGALHATRFFYKPLGD